MVFGCSRDKRLADMLALLPGRVASFTATQASLSRALPADDVAAAASRSGLSDSGGTTVVPDAWNALQRALSAAGPEDVVCVAGSLFLAGEVRGRWFREGEATPPA
jgi:dihydrofolate synthase/folylpolyglutamate synthase